MHVGARRRQPALGASAPRDRAGRRRHLGAGPRWPPSAWSSRLGCGAPCSARGAHPVRRTRPAGVEIAGAELAPRQQIGSVAYAVRAAHAVHAAEADHAARANSATTATNATNATTAGRATSAGTADSATNAGYANSAGTATNVYGSGSVVAASATINGTATVNVLNANSIAHVRGAVVGGFRIWTDRDSSNIGWYNCAAWGDGRCSTDRSRSQITGDCSGGSGHPSGYVQPTVRDGWCIQD